MSWARPGGIGAWLCLLLVSACCVGCSHDVPEHDVVVSSDCSGASQSARFHFEATDFSTNCTGGLLSGTCSTNEAKGQKVSGELDSAELVIEGWEDFGADRYELRLRPPSAADIAPYEPIRCSWAVDESLELTDGDVTPCYVSSQPCEARIDIEL